LAAITTDEVYVTRGMRVDAGALVVETDLTLGMIVRSAQVADLTALDVDRQRDRGSA
jgi:hypothetical protein